MYLLIPVAHAKNLIKFVFLKICKKVTSELNDNMTLLPLKKTNGMEKIRGQ